MLKKTEITQETFKLSKELDINQKIADEKYKDAVNTSNLDLKLSEKQISIEKENADTKKKAVSQEFDKHSQMHTQQISALESDY